MKRLTHYFMLFLLILCAQPLAAMQPDNTDIPEEQRLSEKEDIQKIVDSKISNEKKSVSEKDAFEIKETEDQPIFLSSEQTRFWAQKFDEANKKSDLLKIDELEKKSEKTDIIEDDNNTEKQKALFWLGSLVTLAHKLDKDHPEEMLTTILKQVIKKLDYVFYEQCMVEYNKRFKDKEESFLDRQLNKVDKFINTIRSQSLLSNSLSVTLFILHRFDGALLPIAYRTSWWLFLPLLAWKLGVKDHFPILRAVTKEIAQESQSNNNKK